MDFGFGSNPKMARIMLRLNNGLFGTNGSTSYVYKHKKQCVRF